MSRLSRTKGHSFERLIAKTLRVVFPGARRQLEYHSKDANGIDLMDTGFYKFQCKRMRKWASLQAIEEIKCDELLGEVPVLVTQGDHKRILACMPFEEFLRLLTIEKDYKNNLKNLHK